MKRAFLRMIVISGVGLATAGVASATIPSTIALQGQLTDATGQPLDGSFAVTFRLYNVVTGGTSLWNETQTVTVEDGLFSTSLGSVNPLTVSFDVPYWLELEVDGELLSPRQPLASGPYSFRAQQLEEIHVVNGNVGIGDTTPAALLTVGNGDLFQVQATGEVLTVVGTATAPSYAFSDDPDTGLYNGGANNLRVVTAGQTRLSVGAAGNVGIGTTNPVSKLDVAGTVTSTGLTVSSGLVALPAGQIDPTEVSFTYASSTTQGGPAADVACSGCISLGTETSGLYDATTDTIADDGVISDAEASDVLTINNGLLYAPTTGNVGIGTTAPGVKLDVVGDIRTTAQLRSTVVTGTAPLVVSSTTKVTNLNADLVDGLEASAFSQFGSSVDSSEITDSTIANVDISSTAAIAGTKISPDFGSQTIRTLGSVGIGTTTPNALLELYAASDPTLRIAENSTTSYLQLRDNQATQAIITKVTAAGSGQSLLDLAPEPKDGTSQALVRFLRSTSTTGLTAIQVMKGNGTATTNAQIAGNGNSYLAANNGNVGIGMSAPTQKLEVNGAVRLVPQGAPASPTAGTIYYDTSSKHFYGYNGTSWKQLDN